MFFYNYDLRLIRVKPNVGRHNLQSYMKVNVRTWEGMIFEYCRYCIVIEQKVMMLNMNSTFLIKFSFD